MEQPPIELEEALDIETTRAKSRASARASAAKTRAERQAATEKQ